MHHLPAQCRDGLGALARSAGARAAGVAASRRCAIRCCCRARRSHLHEAAARRATPVLPGFTYKLKWPDCDHAIYITINDIVQDGRRRPFEIFINSKNMEHYAWTVALTRMISAVFRRGGDVSFVVEELKAVFDPRGGQWMEGRYVPSLLAAIGGVIERHMIETGFLKERRAPAAGARRRRWTGGARMPALRRGSAGLSGRLRRPASTAAIRNAADVLTVKVFYFCSHDDSWDIPRRQALLRER